MKFINHGRDFFATPDNPRPEGDAWRLRWWYHGAVISNHWLEVGMICNRAKTHFVWGSCRWQFPGVGKTGRASWISFCWKRCQREINHETT